MVWPQRSIGRTRLPTERVSRDLIKLILGRRFTIPSPSVSSISSFSTLFLRSPLSFGSFGAPLSAAVIRPGSFCSFATARKEEASGLNARLIGPRDCPWPTIVLTVHDYFGRDSKERTSKSAFRKRGGRSRTATGRRKRDIVAAARVRGKGSKCGIEEGSYFLRFYPSEAGDSFERFESMFGKGRERCRYQSRDWIRQ